MKNTQSIHRKGVNENELQHALRLCKKAFVYTFFFSFGANLLMLALPIFTLQVLDRVVSSGSLNTLAMLTIVTMAAFLCYGLLQTARTFVLIRVSEWLERRLSHILLRNIIASSSLMGAPVGSQALRDFGAIKNFLTGAGLSALFDAPWSLLYIGVILLIHPVNGIIAFFGAVVLFILALVNEAATKHQLGEANQLNVSNTRLVDLVSRNAEAIEAMGMAKQIVARWQKLNDEVIAKQVIASDRSGLLTNLTKFFRMGLQIIIVASGAYLMLSHQLSVGGIIAGSILLGRALAPFEAAIASWKSMIDARSAYGRLNKALSGTIARDEAMQMPTPQGRLSVESLLYVPHGSSKPTVKGVSFAVNPGEIVGVVGPSAAGKSTLAKLVIGVYKPQGGIVRLDGADVYSWNREDFGQHAGYLPQDVELFNGTVKENIARMEDIENIDPNKVVQAAQMAGVHDLILHLPNGYETEIGMGGNSLSAGQRQRIGLARAFYGNPKLVVLDEPNANLDQEGDQALQHALVRAKEKGITTLVVAHRPSTLVVADKILVLRDGTVAMYGPRDEVMAKITGGRPQAVQEASITTAAANQGQN